MVDRISRRIGLGSLAVAAATVSAQAQPVGEREQVVYHLNQPGGENFAYYRQLLVNLRNHIETLAGVEFDLRLVMHGAGLGLLRVAAKADTQVAASVDNLKLAGVRFEICRITLRSNNIRLDELYDATETDLVPSGVVQLARLQRQGFSYIKI